jgi:3-phytase
MKSSTLVCLFTSLILLSSCASKSKKQLADDSFTLFSMTKSPVIGETMAAQKIKLGGFSGLQFAGERDGALFFQTITDRGPNGEPVGIDRPFLLPDYNPMVVVLKADLTTKELTVVSEIKLKKKDNSPLTGLPNTRLEENPTDIFGLYYSIDRDGLDLEGLVFDGDGGWWTSDEYGPSLTHFTEEGKMTRRLLPGVELPRMYANRKANRGFEAVTRIDSKIYGFLQSQIPNDTRPENFPKGEFSRILEVDLESMRTSAEYFYPFEMGNEKIGDAVTIAPGSMLVLEQNGKTGEAGQRYIYRIKLGESDQVVEKTLVADLKNTPFSAIEKVEGIAFIDNHRLAIIYDNDFQIAGKSDFKTGLTPLNESINQVLVIEFKEGLIEDQNL